MFPLIRSEVIQIISSARERRKRVELNGANLAGIDLAGLNLARADLRNTDLDRARLWDCCLSEANLEGSTLEGADLLEADLRSANLSAALLGNARLTGARLDPAPAADRGADLTEAELPCADLLGANLTRTNLYCANLCGARLTDADLSHSRVEAAFFAGADLSGIKDVGVDWSSVNEMEEGPACVASDILHFFVPDHQRLAGRSCAGEERRKSLAAFLAKTAATRSSQAIDKTRIPFAPEVVWCGLDNPFSKGSGLIGRAIIAGASFYVIAIQVAESHGYQRTVDPHDQALLEDLRTSFPLGVVGRTPLSTISIREGKYLLFMCPSKC